MRIEELRGIIKRELAKLGMYEKQTIYRTHIDDEPDSLYSFQYQNFRIQSCKK